MPVPTDFGCRAFEGLELLPPDFTPDYALWRNTQGTGTEVPNSGIPGTADMVASGADSAEEDIWEPDNLLFGDASLTFDGGVSDRVLSSSYSSRVDLSGLGKMTVIVWVRPAAAQEGANGTILFDQGQFILSVLDAGTVQVNLDLGAGFVPRTSGVILTLPATKWTMLAFTYDTAPAPDTGVLYYGDEDDAALTVAFTDTTSWSGTIKSNLVNGIRIGDVASGGQMFNGLIGPILYVPNKVLTQTQLDAIFVRPWLYLNGRPTDPHGDGVRTNTLTQRTADGDSIGIQIAPAVLEHQRTWRLMAEADRAATKLFFKDVLSGGAKLFYLLDTMDRDGVFQRKVRFTNNPFGGFPRRHKGWGPLVWELVEV